MALCKTTTNTFTPLHCIVHILFAIKSIIKKKIYIYIYIGEDSVT